MKDVRVTNWSAWAPGLESADAWRQWAKEPTVPGADQAPAAKFLPSLLRRRCTPLTRMMLTAAFDCLGDVSPQAVRPVFSSRHGSINESISMLEQVALEQRLSPAMFAHTVHNAQAALFSIAAENRVSSSALCAENESFEAGYLEALVQLSHRPAQPVLLVVGDVPLAPGFASLIDEPPSAYALALLLEHGDGASSIGFEMPRIDDAGGSPGDALSNHALPNHASPEHDSPKYAWPRALEFLRWLLSEERQLDLVGVRHGWRWQRR